MKYIVELNPAMHIEIFEIMAADSPDDAVEQAHRLAVDGVDAGNLSLSHWEVINVYPSEEQK